MALYDHGLCMRNDLRDVSLFAYEGRIEPPFSELFRSICADYPEFVANMIGKVANDEFKFLLKRLECFDFIQERINAFIDIANELQI